MLKGLKYRNICTLDDYCHLSEDMVLKLEDLVLSFKSFDDDVILFFKLVFGFLHLLEFFMLFILLLYLFLEIPDFFGPLTYFVNVLFLSHFSNLELFVLNFQFSNRYSHLKFLEKGVHLL